ncbi:MAG: TetR family transcriptional regulator [bacterium]|nr:TetR family transcriptional regulator [bacterium]
MGSLRQRNRARTMRELQSTALDLFEAAAFDTVTIDDVAAAGGVSASTIYRYFGTKENLVIWDGADRNITDELAERIGKQPPLIAFRDSLMEAFSDEETSRALRRRVGFIYANPPVHAAAIEQDLKDRDALAAGFALVAGRKTPSIVDDTLAGVCMATLDAAIEHWHDADPDESLPDMIRQAFAALV